MPTDQPTGRLLVSRRAIADIVRTATLGSYGVAGLAASFPDRLLGRLGLGSPGIRLSVRDGLLSVDLSLEVGLGLPIAEVARQVDSAVRYAVRRGLGREVGVIAIHVDKLRFESGANPPAEVPSGSGSVRPGDLADSGSDVA